MTEPDEISLFVGTEEGAFDRHNGLFFDQLKKNRTRRGHFRLIKVKGAVGKVEAWIEFVDYQGENSAGNFILDAAVAEGIELLAVPVQVEEPLKGAVELEVLELPSQLHDS